MTTHSRTPMLRPRIVTVALAAAIAALALSQCRAIDDPVTGVDVRSNLLLNGDDNDECKRQCKETYKECRREENGRHDAAEGECDQIQDEEQRDRCEDAEDDLHDQNNHACKTAKKQCKNACRYHEGAARGGR